MSRRKRRRRKEGRRRFYLFIILFICINSVIVCFLIDLIDFLEDNKDISQQDDDQPPSPLSMDCSIDYTTVCLIYILLKI